MPNKTSKKSAKVAALRRPPPRPNGSSPAKGIFVHNTGILLTTILFCIAASSNGVDDRHITIKSPADADAKRAALIKFIWGETGMPAKTLPAVEKNDKSPVSGLEALKRVDTLTITMEAGEKGYAHHFIPQKANNRLVILHHGHAITFADDPSLDKGYGMQRTINGLLKAGYSVLAVYMPHMANFTTHLTVVNVNPMTHDEMFRKIKVQNGSAMKFFLEPVAVSLNYLKTKSAADDFPAYKDFSMIGLSGGGWTTTIYAAIDPTISLSIPVAGTTPLYLRFGGSVGDTEQYLAEFYRIAGYPDLYVLGAHGAGRQQIQILNRRDDCCFGQAQHDAKLAGMSWDDAVRTYERNVQNALKTLGESGVFRVEIDDAAPAHMISWNAFTKIILPELNAWRERR